MRALRSRILMFEARLGEGSSRGGGIHNDPSQNVTKLGVRAVLTYAAPGVASFETSLWRRPQSADAIQYVALQQEKVMDAYQLLDVSS